MCLLWDENIQLHIIKQDDHIQKPWCQRLWPRYLFLKKGIKGLRYNAFKDVYIPGLTGCILTIGWKVFGHKQDCLSSALFYFSSSSFLVYSQNFAAVFSNWKQKAKRTNLLWKYSLINEIFFLFFYHFMSINFCSMKS